MGAFITHPPLSSDRRASLLLFRLFHRLPPSLCISGCSSPLPLSNEQPAPGHITPTDKMPPLSRIAPLLSLPPSLSLSSPTLPPFLAHLPRRLRIGVSPRASSRQPASQKMRLSTKAHLPVLHPIPDLVISILKGIGPKGPHASCCRPPPIIEISPALSLSANRLCLRFTHEITRHDRVGIRPAAGQAVGVGRRERNMCLQKEDISFGDVYRLLPASVGRTDGRRQHTNIARGQLGSGSAPARACNQKEKVGSLSLPPSLQPSTHPGSSHYSHLPRCIACTLQIAHPFLPPRPFLIFTWLLSVRPSVRVRPGRLPPAQTRLTLGRFPVCLPLRRPHSLARSLTHTR